MCEHCGCREFGPIQRLYEEHNRLLALIERVRDEVRAGDLFAAGGVLTQLIEGINPHSRREEKGLYLQLDAEDAEYVQRLMAEHREVDELVVPGNLVPGRTGELLRGLDLLSQHIFVEEQDLFPYAYQVLSNEAWDRIDQLDRQSGFLSPELTRAS